jgi:hypothetical protein
VRFRIDDCSSETRAVQWHIIMAAGECCKPEIQTENRLERTRERAGEWNKASGWRYIYTQAIPVEIPKDPPSE